MAVEIEFVDAVPERNRSGRQENPVYAEIVEALTGNPGANARVFTGLETAQRAYFRANKLVKLGLVAVSRANEDGQTFDVYAKFDGEPVAKAPAKPRAARKPAAAKAAAPKAPRARKASAKAVPVAE